MRLSHQDYEAMHTLHFVVQPTNGGSKHKFVPQWRRPNPSFCWDRPHDKVICKGVQDDIAAKMTRLYGWRASSFKLSERFFDDPRTLRATGRPRLMRSRSLTSENERSRIPPPDET
ncbi:hypothetical protein PYCCODRAFT_1421896 [Trametes coccinea BRFM310]|uniref:Uncharacterized protein n=1 Tax=Trametes coccinea (strain BRFM310) TaxID=1353009 RepID=A0A1Y2J5N1_TRAC3|nr:hypothetical protein PYCCODRAFT_1421896 [Trametes coccinea BRFM310]